MRLAIAILIVAYVLSQFFRAFLPVMTPVLSADLGVTAGDLSRANGLWFLIFAAMQIPVGWALDRFGPRRLTSLLLALGGGGGAALFALAQNPFQIQMAVALTGIGCAPVLMASYFIFARMYPPALFGTLAGLSLGIGSLGNIFSSMPTAYAIETVGWRGTMWGVAGLTFAVSALIFLMVKDPPPVKHAKTEGSLWTLLKMPVLWAILPIMAINYAPSASLRGSWAGPYLGDVFGLSTTGIGQVTLVMGLAMIAGALLVSPMDRVLGSRKWVVFPAGAISVAGLFALWAMPDRGVIPSAVIFAIIGFFGSTYPMIMAHARSFMPDHLVGRGVTFFNLVSMAGAGIFQFSSAWVYQATTVPGDPLIAYRALFLYFAIPAAIGTALYLFSHDRTD
ncbi:MAG: MFS transporter [Rhodobacterales bacterium]|nr:MAG: MFS transporter [Rhodobacterales bacterium]